MKRKIFYPIAFVAVLAFVLFACRRETIDVFVENVTLDMSTATLDVNGTLRLVVTIDPEDAYNQNVRWKSSDTSVATVSDAGVVSAKAPGTTTIIVTTEDGGFTATCIVTVIRQVVGITISPKPLSLTEGKKEVLTAIFTPSDASNQTVNWSSSNSTIAEVDHNGVVTAISAGATGTATATIRATTQDGTKYDECTVTVTKAIIPVVAVTINPTVAALSVNGTQRLTYTVYPENATTKTVTWSSDKPAVASISLIGSDVVVTALSAGTAIITATTTDGGKTATCTVNVSTVEIPVTGIFLDPPAKTMNVGDPAEKLIYTIQPANATNQNVVWTSSNTAIVTVESGTVTPKAVGSAVVSVTALDGSGKTATCIVTVITPNVPVTGVTLPGTLTINGSETTKTLTASISPNGATNKKVTWISSDQTVATVSGTGLEVSILPVAPTGGTTTPRTTTITVTTEEGTKTATCLVTVNYVAVTGVTVTPATLTKHPAENETLTATVLPANASIKTVKWSSSAPSIVFAFENTGLITALTLGSAIITATSDADNTKTGNCVVTVN